MKKLTIRN